MSDRAPSPKLLADLFFSFAKISLLTVGGGPAMIPLVMNLATERRGWLSQDEMTDCLTIAQSLPGGVIVNMATYIGARLCGVPGMIAATFGAIFPTATLAVVIGLLLGNIDGNVYAAGAIQGAKAAAVGLVLAAFIKLGSNAFKKPAQWIIAGAAMAVVIIWHISPVWAIVAGGLSGWMIYRLKRKPAGKRPGGDL